MCELLGLNSSQPMDMAVCLRDFRMRGGGVGDNPDGWGISYKEGAHFRLVKEPLPAARSELYAQVSATLRSDLVLAHVRKAKYPLVNTLVNTHPFKQVCCGKEWVFAHNGLVPAIIAVEKADEKAVCRPDGQTDSESAFCHLLGHIAQQLNGTSPESGKSWLETVAQVAEVVAAYGQFNFLLSDGEYLIAYAHDRLHYLECYDQTQDMVFIATEPLPACTPWLPFKPGELRIYRYGRLVGDMQTCPPRPPDRTKAMPILSTSR